MLTTDINAQLLAQKDEKYAEFQRKLIPTISSETVIGVRTPFLRSYAKQLAKEENIDGFLHALPHSSFEENQLHAFIIAEIKDYKRCMAELERFLPFIDNWATCDQLSPSILKKHTTELLTEIQRWLKSAHPYTVRFAIGMLMRYYLDDLFAPRYLEWVASVKRDEFYIQMMVAWYFATALAKQYQSTLPYLEKRLLDEWTHRKTIQKAIESFRITDEQKDYLRTLRKR